MSVPSLHRRSARIATAVVAALSAAAGVSGSALAARHAHVQRLEIVRPYRTDVSGTIFFAVRGIRTHARRIVFSIDGRRVWSAGRVSPRLRRATAIDTRKLRNGRHMLSLRVTYANRSTDLVRKPIVVHNRRPGSAQQAHPAGAGRGGTTGSGASSGGTTAAGGTTASGTGTTGSGGAFGPPSSPVSGPSVAAFNRESYLYSSTLPAAQEANRYQVIVLDAHDYPEVPLLKAANPNLKIVLYQAIMFTNSDDYSYMQTATGCTAYADDLANHPTWFLHDQNGNRVLAPNRTDLYALDVGNPAYEQACATNAAAFAKRYGFDGIFFDVVDGNLSLDVSPGVTIPEYPSAASWQNAMNAALGYLGPALRAQGLLAFGNVSGAASTSQWQQWVSHLDGVEEEAWTDGGGGLAQQIPWFSQKLDELSWAMSNDKYEIVHSYNGGEAANTYGLATMLLAATGRASYATSNTDYTSQENWFPEYDTAQQLGAAAGPYTVLANGVYERAFAGGIVLVNPTGSSIPSFSLGGGTYMGSGLTNVRSVALGPTSGLILLKVA
jgi:hypothetical protein